MSMDRLAALRTQLEEIGQGHLNPDAAAVELLADTPLERIPDLIDRHVLNSSEAPQQGDLAPAQCVTGDSSRARGHVSLVDEAALRSAGEAMIADGKVAAFTVAGGQGTRLGWAGPKGAFPASPVTGKPLFRLFAEQLLAAQRRFDCQIRWYIMTSRANDAETRAFFLDNRCFGLERSQIMMFPQGMMPVFDAQSGRMLEDAPGIPAMSPDGHGGSYAALQRSGALEQMDGRGVEVISYFQVDNPLVHVLDPVFLGLHADSANSSGEFTSKMVSKQTPSERVGVFARQGSATTVIEYSDLPDDLAEATDAQGHLRFDAGNVAVHAIGVAFAAEVASEGVEGLPWHRALKAVPYWDVASQSRVEPDAPNAVKLERFVFDALDRATRPAILEVDRSDRFAPIKNATGADSPETSRRLQSDLYGRWLEACGVRIPRSVDGHVDATIEISPLTAMRATDLAGIDLPDEVPAGTALAI